MRTALPKNAQLIPPEAKRVFEGIIFDVYQWEQEQFDGSKKMFEMLRRPDSVHVIAIKDGKIVVFKQQQPGHTAYYDAPGGRHDDENETELEAMQRELLEETGMRFKTWKLVDAMQVGGTKIEHFIYTFIASDFEGQDPTKTDAGEKIEIQLLELDAVKKLLDSPLNRTLPKEILNKANSIEELLALPEYR